MKLRNSADRWIWPEEKETAKEAERWLEIKGLKYFVNLKKKTKLALTQC